MWAGSFCGLKAKGGGWEGRHGGIASIDEGEICWLPAPHGDTSMGTFVNGGAWRKTLPVMYFYSALRITRLSQLI